jgi:hypothetical protein
MDALATLINKIHQCTDYQTLYALESDFNQVGLTIQTTANSRMILCKIVDSKPKASEAMKDYIYIGSLDISAQSISIEFVLKVIIFVVNAKGPKGELKNLARKWQDGLRMYGQAITVEETIKGTAITEDKNNYQMIED